MQGDRSLAPDHFSYCIPGASRQTALDRWVEGNLGESRPGSWSGKQQRGHQEATHRQEGEDRSRLAGCRRRTRRGLTLVLGPDHGPMFQLIFFAIGLGRSELGFGAMRGTAVLLVH